MHARTYKNNRAIYKRPPNLKSKPMPAPFNPEHIRRFYAEFVPPAPLSKDIAKPYSLLKPCDTIKS